MNTYFNGESVVAISCPNGSLVYRDIDGSCWVLKGNSAWGKMTETGYEILAKVFG